MSLPSDASAWPTDRLSDEAVRAIQTCRKHGKAAARHAWQAGAYLSILHARLVKGRKWAAWLHRHEEVVSEDTARRYILLYERTGGRAAGLDGMTLTEAYAAFGITRFTEAASTPPGSNGDGSIHGHERLEADHRRQSSHETPILNGFNGNHHHPVVPNDLEEPADTLAGIGEKAILRAAKEIRQRQNAGRLRRQREREEAARAQRGGKRTWVVTADQRVARCHAVIADPPYGISGEPWEPEDLEGYTREWCGRWSKCGADLVAIFWSQGKLFEGRRWFDESLSGYTFQQVLTWHANNNGAHKSRRWLKQSWEPIFLYRRGGSDRLILAEDKAWSGDLHNLDCYVAPVPQVNYSGHDLKQHPTQKPVSVMRWLVHALSEPGEMVATPFCGVAPCGVAAVQLGRKYHGIEIDERYRRIAEGRIAMYGMA
ncbi:DNA-methyltransferase [Tautonia plasticadhaerens]|uniref:DNA-methyltransferase n=1 Tax=Tautonia plasticadhaerens TaxID=2527974 RepID=UPI0011A316E1|nr:site-specific DNA-methyltransferase [Tautonia plasticadhaerens]